MELNYLRVFYEVAKSGKFSEAARKLNISQSALSRSVSLLEEGENVVLFDRSKNGVSLTAKGIDVFRLCEQLFQTEKEIENLCRGSLETCEGPLRFSASDHVINHVLPKHIAGFKKDHPKVIPSIQTGTPDEIVHQLLTTDCEFALLFAKINTPQIEFKKLYDEKMALVCLPEMWRESKSSNNEKTLRKLIAKYGYISSIGVSTGKRTSQVLMELFGEFPRISFESNSQETQKHYCLNGLGVAYLMRFMVEEEIERGELFEIPVEHIHEFHLWLARPKGKQMSLTARTFLEYLGFY